MSYTVWRVTSPKYRGELVKVVRVAERIPIGKGQRKVVVLVKVIKGCLIGTEFIIDHNDIELYE